MKNYLKPITLTFVASVLCASSANAFLDKLDPRNIGKKITDTLRPGQKNPGTPQKGQNTIPENRIRNYGPSAQASASYNSELQRALGMGRSQIGQTAIDTASVNAIYSARGGRAIWTTEKGLSNMGRALYDLLSTMPTFHGLETQYYLTADVDSLLTENSGQLVDLEILLTQGYMLFVKDVSTGRINPKDPSQNLGDIEMKKHPAPTAAQLTAVLSTPESLFSGVANMAPNLRGYNYLLESLAKINDGIAAGGWAPLDSSVKLAMGDSHPNVIGIRQRLVDFGFMQYNERNNPSQRIDAKMDEAIRRFQENNFLVPDGKIGPGTYGIMSQPVQKFKNQIRANIEKWRFYPRSFPQRYMMVDMGRQELDVFENGQIIMRMKTVVGGELTGTPTMTDRVTSIVLAPYWTSPNSIIVKETIPKMLSSGAGPASYLAAQNVEVRSGKRSLTDAEINSVNWSQYTMQAPPPYLFRQKRGEGNALGLVKFNLTNAHSIYLHDTNAKARFNDRVRYLSHGCIRLQMPMHLAAYLTKPELVSNITGRTEDERMQRILESLTTEANNLEAEAWLDATEKQGQDAVARPIAAVPVFIFGSTTVNYNDGSIGFGQDIYKQDEKIIAALNQMANPLTAKKAIQSGN